MALDEFNFISKLFVFQILLQSILSNQIIIWSVSIASLQYLLAQSMMPTSKSTTHNIISKQNDKEYFTISDIKEESTLLTNLPPEKIHSEQQPEHSDQELQQPLPKITIFRKHYYYGNQLTEIYDAQKSMTTVRSKGKISYILSQFNEISQMGPYLINTSSFGSSNVYNCSDWKQLSSSISKCYCTKSSCQQNYCSCYINNKKCNIDCFCFDCRNIELPMKQVDKMSLDKFKDENEQDFRIQKKKERIKKPKKKDGGHHSKIKGCNCKKAGSCLKSYCPCHRLGINCGYQCNCLDCKN